jgi:EAL domain-containing protein (putative c-di-GMP-specific phosphodiesterase class I)/CheY-like chemotaxis protein
MTEDIDRQQRWICNPPARHASCDPHRAALAEALRDALRAGQLHLAYQPQVAFSSGEIVGIEALLRWHHPVHGEVSPAIFVPIAEEAGLIGPIGDWVLERACAAAAAWQRAGLPATRMMINVSAWQLRGGRFAQRIAQVLAGTGLEPRRLGLELTETALMGDTGEVAAQLTVLRKLGVEIALDDFGTGHSSLTCLSRLPLDAVKIDRSLVPTATGNSDALPITRAIIAMAHSLGLKAVAEGVETEGQLELLAANRCDAFQGYHFSAPVPAGAMGAMLRAGRRMPVLERRRAARTRTVLLVDDERWVLDRLRQQLPLRFGETIRVEAFQDPQEALTRLRGPHVDVVVSDLLMPGVDGITVMNRAKELQPAAVRMMLLGPADLARIVDDERQVDVYRYLTKPWTGEQLLKHFDAALAQADRTRGEQVLDEALGQASRPGAATLELLDLEAAEPGLTRVARGTMDEVVLPSQLMTMPGDLWTADAARDAGPRWRSF